MSVLALFKIFFPSWKFFDELGDPPALYYRVELGPWVPCIENRPRGHVALFLNAEGNLRLACNSLLERMVSDINELPSESISSSISYRLVRNLVRSHVGAAPFQFKIVVGGEDVLISRLEEFSK